MSDDQFKKSPLDDLSDIEIEQLLKSTLALFAKRRLEEKQSH